jgi:hypothetical protein
MRLVICALAAAMAFGADNSDLARFLVKAKAHGYASGVESRIHKLPDGGLEIGPYIDGPFSYSDRWHGETSFSGEEVALHQGKPVWGMNFYGVTAKDAPAEFPKFHKSALMRAPVSLPFRGPLFCEEGDFVYTNDVTGTIDRFTGVERVLYKGEEIFRLVYHGGRLE